MLPKAGVGVHDIDLLAGSPDGADSGKVAIKMARFHASS